MSLTKLSVSLLIFSLIMISCSAQQALITEKPYSQASVVVHLKNGERKEGIVLKRVGNDLVYIDAKSHKKEKIDYAQIRKLTKADVVYDFEANPIPNYVIKEEKGKGNTLLYGSGGLVLGAAVGTGVSVAIISAKSGDVEPFVSLSPIILGAICGAWYFGMLGSDYDYEDAVFKVRKKRAEASKGKRDREIELEKAKLEEQKKKKEELLKKIDKKKKK
ncbi:MAG: hypothetical protein D8M58_03390 [Calditrichaeota bacterium]|nr:MAG: hypothetical protein DWQ03_03685 [Calditrichota bacterium]MBL1204410.1 hypothetical protein [Calditrichota bacterium]NOG44239.1 hypothetical protein [Calditrichota bacterium]